MVELEIRNEKSYPTKKALWQRLALGKDFSGITVNLVDRYFVPALGGRLVGLVDFSLQDVIGEGSGFVVNDHDDITVP
jgi:hypothetical protein